MTTVIDELVLSLGLDPQKFVAGQKQAIAGLRKLEEEATKHGKETEAQSKKLLDFFVTLKREAIGFLSAFYGGKGLADVVDHMARLDSTTGRLARNFGVSTPFLATWISILRQTGSSAEAAEDAVRTLSETIANFAFDPSQAPEGFLAGLTRIGVKPEDYQKPEAIMEALARYAQTPAAQRDIPGFRAFGRSMGLNPDVLTALADPKIAEYRKNAEALTLTTEKTSEASKKLVADLSLFEQASESLARVLGIRLIPVIEEITKFIEKYLPILGGEPIAKADLSSGPGVFTGPTGGVSVSPTRKVSDLKWGSFGIFSGATGGVFGASSPASSGAPSGHTRGGNTFAPGETITGIEIVSDYVSRIGARSSAAAHRNSFISQARHSSTNVHIGNIHVNAPHATDAGGIAKGIGGAVRKTLSDGVNFAN